MEIEHTYRIYPPFEMGGTQGYNIVDKDGSVVAEVSNTLVGDILVEQLNDPKIWKTILTDTEYIKVE